MNKIEPKYGVTLYHLKGKFAYGSTTGNEISEFKYDENEAKALFNLLHNGPFDGMFDVLSLDEYKKFIELNYWSLMNQSRNTLSASAREELSKAYDAKVKELEEKHQKESSGDVKEPQAE